MIEKRESPATQDRATSAALIADTDTTDRPSRFSVASQQVSWKDVHEFVAPYLEQIGEWPMVGTPAWCALDDADPAKWASLLDASQHHALRLETCQQARAEASRAISAAEDWSAIGREIQARRAFYNARPWLRRVPS